MLLSAIIIGIVGTALMTLFMYAMSYLTKRKVKVVKILGTMLTFQTTREKGLSNSASAILTGLIVHYIIGILFAIVYLFSLQHAIIVPSLLYSLIYGFIAGIIGIGFWRLFFLIHPNPPSVSLKTYLLDLVIGHVVFGLGCWIAIKSIIPALHSIN
jgi:hypothetical protein